MVLSLYVEKEFSSLVLYLSQRCLWWPVRPGQQGAQPALRSASSWGAAAPGSPPSAGLPLPYVSSAVTGLQLPESASDKSPLLAFNSKTLQ